MICDLIDFEPNTHDEIPCTNLACAMVTDKEDSSIQFPVCYGHLQVLNNSMDINYRSWEGEK